MTEQIDGASPAKAESKPVRRMSSRLERCAILLFLTVFVVSIDQVTKAYAQEYWRGQPPQIFFNDLFRIEYAENHGAFLSLLANTPPEVRFWILTVINSVVLGGIAIGILTARKMQFWSFLPLALVIAGGIGNLIDRIRFHFVIDFLNLGIGNLRTGIFNVADMAITAGFFLIVPLLFQNDKPRPKEATGEVPLTTAPLNRPT